MHFQVRNNTISETLILVYTVERMFCSAFISVNCQHNLDRRYTYYVQLCITFSIFINRTTKVKFVFGNGKILNDSQFVEINRLVEVTCESSGGRPSPRLSWLINGVDYATNIDKCTDTTEIGVITSCIEYMPQRISEDITCVVALGSSSIDETVEKTVQLYHGNVCYCYFCMRSKKT